MIADKEQELEIGEEEQIPEDQDQEQEQDQPSDENEDEDEIVVTVGNQEIEDEQQDDKKAPQWVRDLRKNYRTTKKENRELRHQLNQITQKESSVATDNYDPGPIPTLEDNDYDQEKFNQKLSTWKNSVLSKAEKEAEVKVRQKSQNDAWQQKLNEYAHKKSSLKVRDYDDAEQTVQDALSVTQQGLIVQGADNPALLVYALGKNPKLTAEFASINDPIEFAFKIAKLETQLKTSKKTARTKPEKPLKTTGKISGTTDSTLERLRAEADKTGNYTKVHEYRRMLKKRKAG